MIRRRKRWGSEENAKMLGTSGSQALARQREERDLSTPVIAHPNRLNRFEPRA